LQQKLDGNIREISLKECRALIQQFYDSKEHQVSAKVVANATADKKRTAASLQLQVCVYLCGCVLTCWLDTSMGPHFASCWAVDG
jgi:hypothetical protein